MKSQVETSDISVVSLQISGTRMETFDYLSGKQQYLLPATPKK